MINCESIETLYRAIVLRPIAIIIGGAWCCTVDKIQREQCNKYFNIIIAIESKGRILCFFELNYVALLDHDLELRSRCTASASVAMTKRWSTYRVWITLSVTNLHQLKCVSFVHFP